jgi:DNA-binding NarL/FixJ family response regulator
VPESFEQAAVRDARARAAARRRAADVLRLAALASTYAAGQVSDGLGPVEAQVAVRQAAQTLAEVVLELRRLAPLEPGEVRAAAAEMAGLGIPRREIARRLGITESTARKYLRSRSPGR